MYICMYTSIYMYKHIYILIRLCIWLKCLKLAQPACVCASECFFCVSLSPRQRRPTTRQSASRALDNKYALENQVGQALDFFTTLSLGLHSSRWRVGCLVPKMAAEHTIGTPPGGERKQRRFHSPLHEMDGDDFVQQPCFDVTPVTPGAAASREEQCVTLAAIAHCQSLQE